MKKYILSLFFIFIAFYSYSTTYYAIKNGALSDITVWSLTQAGAGGAGVPTTGDDIYTNGFIVGITGTTTLRNVFVDDVTVNGLFVNSQLTITGTMIGHSRNLFGFLGPNPNNPTVAVIGGGSTIVFTGINTNTNGGATGANIVIGYWSSSVRIPNVDLIFGGGNTRIFAVSNGTDDIDIGNLTITSGTLSFDLATVTGLRIPGTLVVDGTAQASVPFKGGAANTTFIGAVNISGNVLVYSGSFLNSNILNIFSGGSIVVDNDEPNGWWYQTSSPSSVDLDANSTVFYTRGSAQSIPARTYGNLGISSGGTPVTKTLASSGTLTVLGDLYIGGSTTFSTSSNTNNVVFEGDLTNDGVLTITRPTTFNGGGTQMIDGASAVTFGSTATFSNTMNFDTDITFSSTASCGSNNLSFGGDITNNGTFNCSGTVTFDGATNQIITGSSQTAFNNLTISNTGSSIVTINGTGSNVEGTLTLGSNSSFNANGKLTLISNAGGDARVASIPATSTLSGNIIYQRYISNDQVWHNIGLPIAGSTSDITASDYPDPDASNLGDFARYDETVAGDVNQGWEYSKTAPFSSIDDTQGYSFWTRTADSPGTLTLTGALNTGNKSLSVSRTTQTSTADDGWNLVNNPYASQIDWASGSWTKTNIDATIYVWNGSGYNSLNGTGTIASGQSFWVHSSSGTPVLTAKQGVKTSSGATFYKISEPEIVDELSISLVDEDNTDLTRIRFMNDATEEFDTEYDGYKLGNSIFNLSSVSEAGLDLSINSIPMIACSRIVKLNITNISEGVYQLNFEGLDSFSSGYTFTLKDNFLNSSTNIEEGFTFEFTVTTDLTSYGSGRFEIEIEAVKLETNVLYEITDQCDFTSSLTITNAQSGVEYTLVQNGIDIVSKKASSSILELPLTEDQVVIGLNMFDVNLSNGECGTPSLITDAIEFTINAMQEVSSVIDGENCGNGQVLLKAEGAVGNGYYNWYESADASNPVPDQSNSEYLTPVLETSKFYYVSITNEDGCESIERVKVNAIIKSLPSADFLYQESNQCDLSNNVVITNAELGAAYNLVQNGQVIVSAIASTTSLTLPLNEQQVTEGINTFDVLIEMNGCSTEVLSAIKITYFVGQEITSVVNGKSCEPGEVSLVAQGATGNSYYNWYGGIDATEPIPNENLSEYITPNLDATKSYFVSVVNENGCESSERVEVIAEIVDLPQPDLIKVEDELSTSVIADSYKWFKEDILIENEVGSSIIITESGNYTVEITTNNCSSISESLPVTILGLEQLNELGINVYPNPVIDILNINGNRGKISSIIIYDTKGIAVYRSGRDIPDKINLSSIKKGIYIINIVTDSKTINYRVRKK